MADEVISRRALNRALLARQLLLGRHDIEPLAALDHLIGLQSQAPEPPYWALWARLADFDPAHLSGLLLDRQVVRLAMMRSTLFLVRAADARVLRPLLQPGLDRALRGVVGPTLADLDQAAAAAAVRDLVSVRPRTLDELGRLLVERWPSFDPADLGRVARTVVPLVQVPPRGLWQAGGPAVHTSLETWFRAGDEGHDHTAGSQDATIGPHGLDGLVRRYLAAFGPASVADVQTWSGLTRLASVVNRLRPALACFRDDHGVELFDLPDGSRPDPDTVAPVRLLGGFDNILLSHADRTRALGELDHRRVMTNNGLVRPVVLVDGFVAGTWRMDRVGVRDAVVTITAFTPLARAARSALAAEAAAAVAMAEPDRDADVRIQSA
jgi:hypothetical protein